MYINSETGDINSHEWFWKDFKRRKVKKVYFVFLLLFLYLFVDFLFCLFCFLFLEICTIKVQKHTWSYLVWGNLGDGKALPGCFEEGCRWEEVCSQVCSWSGYGKTGING